MNPVILFRQDTDNKYEIESASEYFPIHHFRSRISPRSLVIGRYSVLPFYKELEEDLSYGKSVLINSWRQHRYIADLGNWYRDLKGITPETWTCLEAVPDSAFPIIVNGETNSKKFLWDTHMFAKDRMQAADVVSNLFNDGLIGDQQLYFRRFENLHTYMDGFRHMPVTKEFRIFILNGVILSKAFYWLNYAQDIEYIPNPDEIPDSFLEDVISRIGKNATFYVVDIAKKDKGEWIVIELNDGQMSGLSMTDPDILYKNMKQVLDR